MLKEIQNCIEIIEKIFENAIPSLQNLVKSLIATLTYVMEIHVWHCHAYLFCENTCLAEYAPKGTLYH